MYCQKCIVRAAGIPMEKAETLNQEYLETEMDFCEGCKKLVVIRNMEKEEKE